MVLKGSQTRMTRVGIVDTGILDGFNFNIVGGHNFTLDLTGRNNISSNLYHGAMVASIITDIVPNVELVIAKMLNEKGVGDPLKASEAIRYCISQGCDIINCSIAGGGDKRLAEAIEEAYSKNIMVVAATGNDGKEKLLYPASYYHCISVGSINKSYELSSFSNYNALMDLVAIGEDITACGITDSGTSFSAPVVTGALVLLKEKLGNPTWEELYKELIDNCLTIDGLEKIKQGNGYINIEGVIK